MGQAPVLTTWPKATLVTSRSSPLPPQVSQVRIGVPGSAPLPRQRSQVETASTDTSREAPASTSPRLTSTWAATSPPLIGPDGPNPNSSLNSGSPRPKNADKTSSKLPNAPVRGAQPPERRPSWPKAS